MIKKYLAILIFSLILLSCKNENKRSAVHETANLISGDTMKVYSQDEIVNLLNDSTFNHRIIIDSNIQIYDSFRIRNNRTGLLRAYKQFYSDSVFCFKKDNKLYLILNNWFFEYNSDCYYIVFENGNAHVLFDSTNMHHACFMPGLNSKNIKFKITLSKEEYAIGDTLKCRALFINQGIENIDTTNKRTYFLDSIDAKYIVRKYDNNIKQRIPKFPKPFSN